MSDPILTIRGVRVGFGDGPDVLRGLDLAVNPGEFVSVLGPSGCGKSTILNVVAGLVRSRDGSVKFLDKEVTDVNNQVGYMTQDDTLLPWRTVFQNVALPLRLRKTPRDEVKERVHAILRLLDLETSAQRFPAQLSGGMKRRALLARSMIYEPKMLMMDEPFAALDAQLRTQMHQELLSMVARTGATVTFITHDIDEAVVLSDRVVVIGGAPGRVIANVDVPFGKERDVEQLRFDPMFLELVRDLHGHLTEARVATAAGAAAKGAVQ